MARVWKFLRNVPPVQVQPMVCRLNSVYHKKVQVVSRASPRIFQKNLFSCLPLNGLNNPLYNVHHRWFKTSSILKQEEKDVNIPDFPESVAEGDVKWNKNVGDSVTQDEVVCEIETDKTSIPVIAPGNGVIVARYAEDGDSVKAHQKIFRIKMGPGGAKPAPKAPGPPAPKAPGPPAPKAPGPPASKAPGPPAPKAPEPPAPKAPGSPPPRSPSPRAKPPPAPAKPAPSKPKEPSKPPPSAPPAGTRQAGTPVVKLPPKDPTREIGGTRSEFRVKMSRMRLKIAERLKGAQNECAMLTTFHEIDMSSIMSFRKQFQEAFQKKHGIKLGFMSAFIKASVYALQDQPTLNAFIDGKEIVYRDYIDISIAVATPKGLVVPVIRNLSSMNFAEIEKSIASLGEKAKKGTLPIEDMDGGTFTISNGGVFGSLLSTPIINPPQSSILGMHSIFDRPMAVKGQVVIRPMMYVSLTYDHRLIDGREAVLFLRKIKDGVENPAIILSGL